MFKQPLATQKRAKFPWGLLVFIIGGASFLFAPSIYPTDSNPTDLALIAATAAPADTTNSGDDAAVTPDNSAEPEFLLAEYNPTPPFYETAPITLQTEGEAEAATDNAVIQPESGDSAPTLPALYPEDGLVAPPDWETSGTLILKVLFVLGLVYLALSGLQWFRQKKFGLTGDGSTITVLETVNLAPGRGLHLITVGEKTLLIGSTEQHLTMLTELADLTPPLPEGDSQFEQNLAEAQTKPPAARTGLEATPAITQAAEGPPPNYRPTAIDIAESGEPEAGFDQVTYSPQTIAAKKPTPSPEVTPTGFEWEMMLGQLRDDIDRVRESSEG